MTMRSRDEGEPNNNSSSRLKAGASLLAPCRRLYAWIGGRVRLAVFRLKQARAVRKGRREDTNRYPLW